ncbi:ADP-ribosylglycohydrolase family protein [Gordonia sp. HNM0687]|uniref:ADP-ribosylglycohydrolase family protein n=1 Tax=Gordonia mangrovi TaxID=2665643 RepID=A0A6L7GZM6_9ACTN|nr:ADP-ribosylglycohydrolase family protein [Gordonia mangrovi]MXP24385.1 ADP-ribosylglycohydrolase family protein [Gordonia mangrovi]UVF79979.1 ADP-ribosylglycohydrolase family protein [Gordonia mangrovi]
MLLSPTQLDRATGVLLGTAVGDALGVPYEFECRILRADETPQMLGGGLGPFAPGEWSDDTSLAMAIALVAATGADLTTDDALDAIAENFLQWFDDGPPDVGVQTRAVLSATRRRLSAGESGVSRVMREEAASYAAAHPHSAGNGALMRTAPVVLAHLDDRDRLAEAARLVASLTHADPLAGDSCVLWCEAIRVAVLDGRIDVFAGLDLLPADRADQWKRWLDDALTCDPTTFAPNGFTVAALQAATAAITHTPADDAAHLENALYAAIRIGNDTDTVAAIAGGLLGARWGASSVPDEWREAVHGWPHDNGRPHTARDLIALAGAVQPGQ